MLFAASGSPDAAVLKWPRTALRRPCLRRKALDVSHEAQRQRFTREVLSP
jgi:hypothetical protein